jgi:hypothetical protein
MHVWWLNIDMLWWRHCLRASGFVSEVTSAGSEDNQNGGSMPLAKSWNFPYSQ